MLEFVVKKKFQFRAGIISTALLVVFFGIFLALGIWQLERAEEKKLLMTQLEQSKTSEPLQWNVVDIDVNNLADLQYHKLSIDGQFETENQLFLDNRKFQGKQGYEVLTPFKIKGSDNYLMVSRGWIAAGRDRAVLPAITTPPGEQKLQGEIKLPPKKHYRPGVEVPAEIASGIWLYMDNEYFSELTGKQLLPFYLILDEGQPGIETRLPAGQISGPEMHLGYAVQWFAFALFSLMAYLSFSFKKVDRDV